MSQELGQLQTDLETPSTEGLDLDQYLIADEPSPVATSPVTLADLERVLTQTSALANRFEPHAQFNRAFQLQIDDGEVSITFDANLFDDHPNTLRLLTYGSELLNPLLEFGLKAYTEVKNSQKVLRCAIDKPLPVRAFYTLDAKGRPQQLRSLADLERVYAEKSNHQWSEEAINKVRTEFEQAIDGLLTRQTQVVAIRHKAEQLVLEERARQTLLQAVLIELAMGQQPELFAEEVLPMVFNEAAVIGLKRHKYPFAPLLKLVNIEGLRPSPTDTFYISIQGQSKDSLRRQFVVQRDRAGQLVNLLANAAKQEQATQKFELAVETSCL